MHGDDQYAQISGATLITIMTMPNASRGVVAGPNTKCEIAYAKKAQDLAISA